MPEIPLTFGKVALVDPEDFEELSRYKWFANKLAKDKWYAARRPSVEEGDPRSQIYMHRVITKTPAGMQTDHINGDTLDNRRSNLRICTCSQNQINQKRKTSRSSKFIGVTWSKDAQKWIAQVKFQTVRHYLGLFESEEEAARARDTKAKELFGEFAVLNFVSEKEDTK